MDLKFKRVIDAIYGGSMLLYGVFFHGVFIIILGCGVCYLIDEASLHGVQNNRG